jgi:hypothetical protein
MSLKILHPWKLSAYLSLSVADFFLTYRLVQQSGGRFYEGNPIAHAWLSDYGWSGLLFFKIVAVLLVGAVCIFISLYRPRLGGNILLFACASVAAVVMYSCSIAGFFGERALPPGTVARGSERRHWPMTPEQEAYRALWWQLVQDLKAEKLILPEAVDQLTKSEEWRNSRRLQWFRSQFGESLSEEGCLAAHLISRVRRSLEESDSPQADGIIAQLEADFLQTYGQPCPMPSERGYWHASSERAEVQSTR